MENLDVRRPPGLDGISKWIIRECREQLSITEVPLVEKRVPKEQKRYIFYQFKEV